MIATLPLVAPSPEARPSFVLLGPDGERLGVTPVEYEGAPACLIVALSLSLTVEHEDIEHEDIEHEGYSDGAHTYDLAGAIAYVEVETVFRAYVEEGWRLALADVLPGCVPPAWTPAWEAYQDLLSLVEPLVEPLDEGSAQHDAEDSAQRDAERDAA